MMCLFRILIWQRNRILNKLLTSHFCLKDSNNIGTFFRAAVGTMFALPWYLTWFGHSLNEYKDVVRLYDFFLASPPDMALYVAASLAIQRRDEILSEVCDMASIHCLLSQIPDDLDFEAILVNASLFFKKYPPNSLEGLVKKRAQKEYVTFRLLFFVHKAFSFIRQLFSIRFYLIMIVSFMEGGRYK